MKHSIYTPKQFRCAVNLAAVLGWASVIVPIALARPNPLEWLAAGLIGLPLAFLLCWIIGGPILGRVMRHPVGWGAAAFWGGVVATAIYMIPVLVSLYLGWRQSLDPTLYSRIGSVTQPRSIDGILTLYGWLVLARDLALFALRGVIIGLIVRWLIGRPLVAPMGQGSAGRRQRVS